MALEEGVIQSRVGIFGGSGNGYSRIGSVTTEDLEPYLNIMLFLNIATGVILVLLGMRYVRKGLDRLFGSQLVDWLQQMTNNRYQAFFGGMVAGLIAPSSSAIAMLSVQMLNQTALTAGRMLAVVLEQMSE
jgi:Na+/Pi-cotransporter